MTTARKTTKAAYRDASELGGTDQAGDREWLRCFRDGNGVLRAGLYDSELADDDDHWAHGRPLTDAADEAAVAKAGGYGRTAVDALRGIAYERLRIERTAGPADVRRVMVPNRLQRWQVTVSGSPGKRDEITVEVRAASAESAQLVAAQALYDRATRNARNVLLDHGGE